MDEKKTPLFDKHRNLNAQLAPFGGWLMPIQYEGILQEREWCRTKASLFDTCHMGVLSFAGDISDSNIEYATTVNIEKIKPGRCSYGFLLNDNGTIIDDIIIYKESISKLMIVVNASTIQKDIDAVQIVLKSNSKIHSLSPALAKIDLQGPRSRFVLENLFKTELSHIRYFSFTTFEYGGATITISRTGYTGELGFELYTDSANITKLWDRLLEHDEVQPAGLGARDLLRQEMGYPLSGQDINESITPLEAGFEMFIHFNKNFRGKEALLQQKEKGIPRRKFVFKTNSRSSARAGFEIYVNDKKAGIVTSGIFSPINNCGIGMGLISSKITIDKNSEITLVMGKRSITALESKLPFYINGTARI